MVVDVRSSIVWSGLIKCSAVEVKLKMVAIANVSPDTEINNWAISRELNIRSAVRVNKKCHVFRVKLETGSEG